MRLITIVLGLSLTALAACDTLGVDDKTLLQRTGDVIESTKAACSFAPTVSSIASILGVPGAPAIGTLTAQLCAEINMLPSFESGEDVQTVTVMIGNQAVEGLLF